MDMYFVAMPQSTKLARQYGKFGVCGTDSLILYVTELDHCRAEASGLKMRVPYHNALCLGGTSQAQTVRDHLCNPARALMHFQLCDSAHTLDALQ